MSDPQTTLDAQAELKLREAERILSTNLGLAHVITRRAFESGIDFVLTEYNKAIDKPVSRVDVLSSHLLEIYVTQFIKALQGR
jgi:hypothetical protein